MKAIILHGTNADHAQNWFPWLKKELEAKGLKVWVPDLPGAEKPNIARYNRFLTENCPFDLDRETILIGHSSGAVAILGWLQSLSADAQVDKCYLAGAFTHDLGWESLKELFIPPLDLSKIKNKAEKFVFVHGEKDDICPLDEAQDLAAKLKGEMHVLPGQKHFSISIEGDQYHQFPFLRDLILEGK